MLSHKLRRAAGAEIKKLSDAWTQTGNGNYTINFTGKDYKAGDVALVFVGAYNRDTHTLPGFTKMASAVFSGQDFVVLWGKVLDGTETTVTSVGGAALQELSIVTSVFRGFSGFGTATSNTNTSQYPNPPAVTGVAEGDWVFCAAWQISSYLGTAPIGYTLTGAVTGSSRSSSMAAYIGTPTIGAENPPRFGNSPSSAYWWSPTVRLLA
jgi:hypothetical protein